MQKGSTETFFRKVKFWKEDGQEEAQAPPVFVGILVSSPVNYGRSSYIFTQFMCREDVVSTVGRISC